MANEIELTEQGKAIEKMVADWTQNSAPRGLTLDQSPNGEVNGQIIQSFLLNNKLPFTVESLNTAVRVEAARFIWEPGFGPKQPQQAPAAATPRKKDRFNESLDSGQGAPKIDPTSTHSYRESHKEDTAKLAAERQTAEVARLKEVEQAKQQYADEHETVYYDGNSNAGGRINHSATESKRAAARERWSKIRGVTLAPTVVREIDLEQPLTRAELAAFTPEELKRALAKQRRGRGY